MDTFHALLATTLTAYVQSKLSSALLGKEKVPPKTDICAIFHSTEPPTITFREYDSRFVYLNSATPSLLLCSVHYIAKFLSKTRHIVLSELNIHRLLTTATMLASKMFSDTPPTTAQFMHFGGISSMKEIYVLEPCFLKVINFDLFINDA